MQSVIHLVSGDETEQRTALNIARNLLEDESDQIDDVAVVAQAGGIHAPTSDGDYAEDVRSLMDDGVPFRGVATRSRRSTSRSPNSSMASRRSPRALSK